MRSCFLLLLTLFLSTLAFSAENKITHRVQLLSNNQVTAWESFVYPGSNQMLPSHRHDHDRVVIALTDGLLKIVNNKGQMHYFKLEKNHAYFALKSPPGEYHTDENVSGKLIKVYVVELK